MNIQNLICLVSFMQIIRVRSVTVEIKFMAFHNPGGLGDNGHCCDGKWGICGSACDHEFTVCLDQAQGDSSINSCRYGKQKTGYVENTNTIESFGSSIGGTENPLVFTMDSWPGKAKLKVEVWDNDDNNNDFVDSISSTIQQSPNMEGLDEDVHSYKLQHRVILAVNVYVYCDLNYYGVNCDKFCNSSIGQCLPDGTQFCPEGSACFKETCQNDTCSNGGTCSIFQDKIICQCSKGWTGEFCEDMVNHCENVTCENGGICISSLEGFFCDCKNSFTGQFCEDKTISVTVPSQTTTTTTAPPTTMNLTTSSSKIREGDYQSISTVSDYLSTTESTPLYGTDDEKQDETPAILLVKGSVGEEEKKHISTGIMELLRDYMNLTENTQLNISYTPKMIAGSLATNVAVLGYYNGKPMNNSRILEIFTTTDEDVLHSYLNVPIIHQHSLDSTSAKQRDQEHYTWIHHKWWVVLLAVIVLVTLVTLVIILIVICRRKKLLKDTRAEAALPPKPSINMGAGGNNSFQNELYFEMNNQR